MNFKYIIPVIIISVLLPLFLTAQGDCPDRHISTDPSAPVNDFLGEPWLNDGEFDWQLPYYDFLIDNIDNPNPNTISIISPFYDYLGANTDQIDNNIPDNKPEDGWEVVAYNSGINYSDGVNPPLEPGVSHPSVILYNRYRAILRVLILHNHNEFNLDYQRANIIVKYKTETQSAILSPLGEATKALDAFDKEVVFESINKVQANDKMWLHADFMLLYDPCVCQYNSELQILVEYLNNSDISLSGKINTENYVDVINGVASEIGDESKPYDYSFSNLIKNNSKVLSSGQKAFDSGGKLIEQVQAFGQKETPKKKDEIDKEYEKATDNGNDANGTPTAITNFINAASPILKEFVPFASSILGMFDALSAIGKPTNPYSVSKQIVPIAFEASVQLDGSISTTTDVNSINFETPGALHNINLGAPEVPLYHNPLGVFNLLETPKIEVYDYGDELVSRHYNIKDGLKYVLNPSSGLEIEDIQTSLLLNYPAFGSRPTFFPSINNYMTGDDVTKPNTSSIYKSGLAIETLTTTYPNDGTTAKLNTGYHNIGCFGDISFILFGTRPGGRIPKEEHLYFTCKILLKLRVKNNPDADPIVMAYTYKVVQEVITTEPVPQTDENGFPPSLSTYYPTSMDFGIWEGNQSDFNNYYTSNVVGPGEIIASQYINIENGSEILPGTIIKAPVINIDPNVTIPNDVVLIAEYPGNYGTCNAILHEKFEIKGNALGSFCSNTSLYKPVSRKLREGNKTGIAPSNPGLSIKIAPNPATGTINLSLTLEADKNITIIITNQLGVKVNHTVGRQFYGRGINQETLDISYLPSGTYNITILSDDGISTKSFIKI